MKVIIQTPDFKARQNLTEFVETGLEKLQRYSNRIQEIRVCLMLDNSSTKENKICEIRVVIPGNDLFAIKQCNTFEEATLQTIDAIRHQLERWKDTHPIAPNL